MHKVGLGGAGDTALAGRGITQGGVNILQGNCPSDITLWFVDMGPFVGNGEEGRRGTHRLPQRYHREESSADKRRGVGDARVRSSAGSGGNSVSNDLYR